MTSCSLVNTGTDLLLLLLCNVVWYAAPYNSIIYSISQTLIMVLLEVNMQYTRETTDEWVPKEYIVFVSLLYWIYKNMYFFNGTIALQKNEPTTIINIITIGNAVYISALLWPHEWYCHTTTKFAFKIRVSVELKANRRTSSHIHSGCAVELFNIHLKIHTTVFLRMYFVHVMWLNKCDLFERS